MEQINKIVDLLELSKNIKILEDHKDFADTPQKEYDIANAAARKAIIEHRRIRSSEHTQREYYKRLYAKQHYPDLTHEQLYVKIKKDNPLLEIDEWNSEIFDLLCRYFTGHESFNEAGYSLSKGICLVGGVGVGKTHLIKKFNSNQVQGFVVKNSREIAEEYEGNGELSIDKYLTTLSTGNPESFYGQTNLGFCFDDIGTDTPKKNYGNIKNTMGDIILSRYDKLFLHQKITGQMTHLTTNLSWDEIGQIYGTRVQDRIKQMFNWITFDPKAPSRRK